MNPFLKEIHIDNFLSLKSVSLPLRNLTIFVGSNASGKSNALTAISWLSDLMKGDNQEHLRAVERLLWAGSDTDSYFSIATTILVNESEAKYEVRLTANEYHPIQKELLVIDGKHVVSIHNNEGTIFSENGEDLPDLPFQPKKPELALKVATSFGQKPKTEAIREFIESWRFFDFQPANIRVPGLIATMINRQNQEENEGQFLFTNARGQNVIPELMKWAENEEEKELFHAVNFDLKTCMGLSIEIGEDGDGDPEIFLQEGYEKLVPLGMASDGTMRLIAYYTLLHHPQLPSLIAIEEPERNLHPKALNHVAHVIMRLSERTQVIITTHSSQLLDSFDAEDLGESLGILLFRNKLGSGTETINLEDRVKVQQSLASWMTDFGVGSALFDSALVS